MKKSSKGKMCMDGLKENWLTLATFAGVLVGKLKMDCPSFMSKYPRHVEGKTASYKAMQCRDYLYSLLESDIMLMPSCFLFILRRYRPWHWPKKQPR